MDGEALIMGEEKPIIEIEYEEDGEISCEVVPI